jgi:hypothetical protein
MDSGDRTKRELAYDNNCAASPGSGSDPPFALIHLNYPHITRKNQNIQIIAGSITVPARIFFFFQRPFC